MSFLTCSEHVVEAVPAFLTDDTCVELLTGLYNVCDLSGLHKPGLHGLC